ncbi:MAG UNVERIFIED_CONTAM: hypothetical protein LVR18_48530 [Planctomycetaceae bacterium]
MNSGPWDGLPTEEVKHRITADLAAQGLGRQAVNFRLRDWLFSRPALSGVNRSQFGMKLDDQGQPAGLSRVTPSKTLPVLHPHVEDFKPTGTPEPMLSKATQDWLYRTAEERSSTEA